MRVQPFLCLLAAWFIVVPSAVFASPGFTLDRQGELYTLRAENAPLAEILDAINEGEGGSLQFPDVPDRTITCAYRGLPLESLLDRLRVNFILTYAWHAEDGYRLESGTTLGRSESALPPALDPAEEARLRNLVSALKSDDISFNAILAMSDLLEAGCRAVPLLEEALWSDDYQMRQVAAQTIRWGCPEYRATPRFLEVTLEYLKLEPEDANLYGLTYTGSAFDYLRDHTNEMLSVKARLAQNLRSSDPQERLLSAVLLAEHKSTEYASTLTPILIPHLADNDLKSDAQLAAYALYQLGPSVRTQLERAAESTDPQQAELAALILYQMDHPDDTTAEVSDFYFCSYNRNPTLERSYLSNGSWSPDRFPDANGNYPAGREPDFVPGRQDEFAEESANEPLEYVVLSGDTLEEIGLLFLVSPQAILSFNGIALSPGERIEAGTRLRIPPPNP